MSKRSTYTAHAPSSSARTERLQTTERSRQLNGRAAENIYEAVFSAIHSQAQ